MPTADELLGPAVAVALVDCMRQAVPGNDFASLRARAGEIGPLGLRERSHLLRDGILDDLPGDFAVLRHAIGIALNDDRFTGWMIWPVSEAVVSRAVEHERAGGTDVLEQALDLLADLTPRLTGEFAIRTLLDADLDRSLAIITTWTEHGDEHVRRLASEGTRPFLPWARRVPELLERGDATRPILDRLRRDPSEYVRRSVANHLNDLNRQQGDLAVDIAAGWLADPDEHTPAMVRRGLRTLIKQGHASALALLGFAPAESVVVTGPTIAVDSVTVGESLPYSATLRNDGEAEVRLAVDYVVHHRKANGTQTAKVFKLAVVTLAAGESVTYERRHSFKPITTRRYHPGEHAIELQVNGVPSGRVTFELRTDAHPSGA